MITRRTCAHVKWFRRHIRCTTGAILTGRCSAGVTLDAYVEWYVNASMQGVCRPSLQENILESVQRCGQHQLLVHACGRVATCDARLNVVALDPCGQPAQVTIT